MVSPFPNFIKTHNSESQGQEGAAIMQSLSELFTCSNAQELCHKSHCLVISYIPIYNQ